MKILMIPPQFVESLDAVRVKLRSALAMRNAAQVHCEWHRDTQSLKIWWLEARPYNETSKIFDTSTIHEIPTSGSIEEQEKQFNIVTLWANLINSNHVLRFIHKGDIVEI